MPVVAAFLLDAVLVTAFTVLGRSSHDAALDAAGIVDTAWPFLIGLLVGWIVAGLIYKAPPLTWTQAVPVWLLTIAVGMLLRWATGDGTALAFVIVATLVVGVVLLGWRVVMGLFRRDRPST